MRISIIILNYNGWQDTIECLESIYQIDYPNYDVILVDNGSKDQSIEKIREYCEGKIIVKSKFFRYNPSNKPIKIFEYLRRDIENKDINKLTSNNKLILIINEKNYGFTEGNNIGIRFALKNLNPDYILFLNNDTVLEKDFFKKIIKNVLPNRIVQPKILKYDNLEVDNLGFLVNILCNTKPNKKKFNEFFYLSGACLLVNKKIILDLMVNNSFFDRELFAYFEDVDISWRARLLGYELYIDYDTTCFHKGGKTSKKVNLNTYYLDFRNKLRVLLKNCSNFNLIWIIPLIIFSKFVFVLSKSIIYKDFRYFESFIKAINWNLEKIRETLEFRKEIQSKRKISDRKLIKYFKII